MRASTYVLRLALATGLLFFVTDCNRSSRSNLDPNAAAARAKLSIDPSLSSIYSNILSVNCVTCHSPDAGSAGGGSGLDFSSQAAAYSTLQANASGQSSPGCHSALIVRGGSVRDSYLVAVFDPAYSPSKYALPKGCVPYAVHRSDQALLPNEYSAITGWIAAGAPNN